MMVKKIVADHVVHFEGGNAQPFHHREELSPFQNPGFGFFSISIPEEEVPIQPPDPAQQIVERIQCALRARGADRKRRVQEFRASLKTVGYGPGKFTVLPQELQYRGRFGTSLVDPPIGIARSEEAQECRELGFQGM